MTTKLYHSCIHTFNYIFIKALGIRNTIIYPQLPYRERSNHAENLVFLVGPLRYMSREYRFGRKDLTHYDIFAGKEVEWSNVLVLAQGAK